VTPDRAEIVVTVNGRKFARTVEPRLLLSDFLRHGVGLTGTHVGCAHGVCGACTVLLDGEPVRSCLLFAIQANGATIATVEGLAPRDGPLSAVQQAFHDHHALQCGFCTPGMVVTVTHFLAQCPSPTEAEVRAALVGNLCRCTGYVNIVAAVLAAARAMRDQGSP
jgi:carbon-monoxide dehydrogenase small subunit